MFAPVSDPTAASVVAGVLAAFQTFSHSSPRRPTAGVVHFSFRRTGRNDGDLVAGTATITNAAN